MTEYSRMARGRFVSTGSARMIFLPFKPNKVRIINQTSIATPADHGIPIAEWNDSQDQGTGSVQLFNSTPVLTTDDITTGGFQTFEGGLSFQFGTQIQISGITKAASAVVTTGSVHGYSTGDVVIFQGLYQSSTTGMPQICTIPFVITVTGTTTFTIPWNTNQSEYTALSGSPSGAYVKKISYPDLYVPGVSPMSAFNTSTGLVTLTRNHNCVAGQLVAFRIPPAFGSTQLNSLPNATIPGSPKYYRVVTVNSNTTLTIEPLPTSVDSFSTNLPFASVSGQQFAQMVPVGDLNTGANQISAGSSLYPSPVYPTFSGGTATIGGPAILGSFVNNTGQGFIVGAGSATGDASSVLVGSTSDVIDWEAYYFDIT